MTTADELASSLRCAEFLADSPSTSTLLHHHHVGTVTTTTTTTTITNNLHHNEHRRRSGRVVLQPVNQRRLSHGQPTVVSRKRPSTVDVRLNTAQHPSVPSCLDRSIHRDERVLENLLIAEENLKSNHLYFTAVQEHIEPIHREQAVEWIFDVAKEEKCDADVFPLAVSLIDRFLSLQNIFRQDIQVLAGVCLFIASKVKAPQPMNAARVSYYTADSVKVHDVLSWELLVLAHLNWEITSPTGFDFFDHLSARLPSLHTLRPAFTSVLHRIQRCKYFFMQKTDSILTCIEPISQLLGKQQVLKYLKVGGDLLRPPVERVAMCWRYDANDWDSGMHASSARTPHAHAPLRLWLVFVDDPWRPGTPTSDSVTSHHAQSSSSTSNVALGITEPMALAHWVSLPYDERTNG
ncbi:cyclin domain protein [Cooperia oncophora]